MSIFLVRHGETASNAARIVQTPDVPLSAHGTLQAQRLASRLASLGVSAVVSSDFLRARMTAESLCRACRAPIDFWPELRERSFGALRGRPYSECPTDLFGPAFAPPGGETWETFHDRVARAWKLVTRVAAETRGNLAVVSHGLVCRSIVERCVGLGDRPAPTTWPNTSLTIVSAPAPHELVLLNCAEHVGDLLAPAAATI